MLIAVASLVAIGHCHSTLRIVILGALRAGCSKSEIIEAILQSIVHVGFPTVLTAMRVAVDAFMADPEILKPKKKP